MDNEFVRRRLNTVRAKIEETLPSYELDYSKKAWVIRWPDVTFNILHDIQANYPYQVQCRGMTYSMENQDFAISRILLFIKPASDI